MRIIAISFLAILFFAGVVCYFHNREESVPPLSGADRVTVETLDEPLPEREKSRHDFLWDRFANKPEERQFNNYGTENWETNFTAFSEALIKKAREKNLDATSLRQVLEKVRADAELGIAYLPIGAYQTTLAGKPVWIVVVKWEWENTNGGGMGHIRMYAFDQTTLGQVGFSTCM